jgi:hypothetical protein
MLELWHTARHWKVYTWITLEHSKVPERRAAFEPRRTDSNYEHLRGHGKMKFQYTTLQPGALRAIRFSQYCTPTFIHAWLEHIDDFSNASSPYRVVSYCADSDLSNEHKSITLNGRSFMVPPALWDALSAIIACHDKDSALWVDAISINHGDGVEALHQFDLMHRIFVCHINRVKIYCLSLPAADSYAFPSGVR